MHPDLAAADAAIAQKNPEKAIEILIGALSKPEKAPAILYVRLAATLYGRQRFAEAVEWTKAGAELFPKEFDLWNTMGVCLRRLRRLPEALEALEKAHKLAPKAHMALINKANVLNDMGNGAAALPIALRLSREKPATAEFHRMAAVAYRATGEIEKAIARLDTALRLQPTLVDAWTERMSIASGLQTHAEALEVAERALEVLPGNRQIEENRIILLRRAGREQEAIRVLREKLSDDPGIAWAHYQMGRSIADRDRRTANEHFRAAVLLEPDNNMFAFSLAESLDRSRYGDEGANIQAGYDIIVDQLRRGPIRKTQTHIARQLALRVADYATVKTLGSFRDVGREWALGGHHAAFLQHLARVETYEDRDELMLQHRMWGQTIEGQVKRNPITYPAPRAPGGKIRLGIMSSDLRGHPVAYFAMPIFEFLDKDRFEVFCYSFYIGEKPDEHQQYIMDRTTFRWVQSISDRDAAQMIANDQLDILFELGGSTHMNKLEVMAYKPAPIQASWLGYPHSAGLEAIDYLLTDPYVTPEREGMLLEQPLKMPKTWISLGTNAFRETDVVNPQTPEERNGFITFGTANNVHKYNPNMLRIWARTVAAVPNSQFMFVRPEGSAPAFRANIRAAFEKEGVAPNRVKFAAVRGKHLPFYNEMDVSLDTFPLTGGTTTCETLWMGVPCVAMLGDAFFERLSYSIMMNTGVGDLVARSEDEFIAIAAKLAADAPRRQHLRQNLREMMKASPLGQREQYAKDFYDLIARTVAEHKATASA